ncbi:hypothetical protein BDN67DRAFT_1013789 [Paxillus ammoniavirescens]|nr:hypothetical protein BDN67DRAFT_1013789 [Paxillus ammoniavirescens]
MGKGDKPFGTSEYVTIDDLSPGNIIWADVFVHVDDLVNKNSNSSTALAAKSNQSHKRYCVVLQKGDTFVDVTYFATFNGRSTFPEAHAEKLEFWYPVRPAQKGSFTCEPLPAFNNLAQWASLRRKHRITGLKRKAGNKYVFCFEKFPVTATAATATTLYWAMLDTPPPPRK